MINIGIGPDSGIVHLSKGAGLSWVFRWEQEQPTDPTEFPAGATLELIIGAATFPFLIDGDTATISIEPTVTDAIENNTGGILRFTESGELPENLGILKVKRHDPQTRRF
ncbi:LtfC-like domain-containing protein [Tomitella gaofuii]|uniref:LtfC-like domain-containing protein n=1 Tax=Tomitella gaofuii TaxID=2760083 RepID=UPI0015FDC504|nr:hypothetical protein [Tomitella gaofuii]